MSGDNDSAGRPKSAPLPADTVVTIPDEEINRFFRGVWQNPGCEICGEHSWTVPPAEARYVYLPAGNGSAPRAASERIYPCLALTCSTCGNMKTMAVRQVMQWLEEHPAGSGDAPGSDV